MADELIAVSADWAKRAYVDDAKYQAMYEASVKDPDRFWGEHGKRVDWIKPYSAGAVTRRRLHRRRPHPLVRRRRAQRRRPTASTATSPSAATRPRSSGKATIRPKSTQDHLSRAARRGLPLRQCAEGARRQEGRPRHHLPADDPRGGRTPCSPARASARSIRWCSAASRPTALAGRIHDCDSDVVITADEGLRGGKPVPLKANVDEALEKCPDVEKVLVVRRTGGKVG